MKLRLRAARASGSIRKCGALNHDDHDPNVALSLRDSMVEGFMEDKSIIEGQQELLDADPDFKFIGIKADGALVHFRRTLDRLIAEEREQVANAV